MLTQNAGNLPWRLFQGLFAVSAIVAGAVTFIAVSDASPVDPFSGNIPWILGLNTILIGVLAGMLYASYRAVRKSEGPSGSDQLAKRFVRLFSLSAVLPALVVGILLGATVTRGIQTWFSDRVDVIVDRNAAVARENIINFTENLEADARLIASEFIEASGSLGDRSDAIEEFLRYQAFFRNFQEAAIIDRQGNRLAAVTLLDRLTKRTPDEGAFAEAGGGDVALTLYQKSSVTTALIRLSEMPETYLYLHRPIDQNFFRQIDEAAASVTEMREAREKTSRLQMIFAIGYAQMTALVLLLAARFGLSAASRVTAPIGRLATAAHAVRDGDLTVRVEQPAGNDEVAQLTRSFNGMTEQLSAQRSALISAREEAEDRRQFVETLLAEVSAGVIRTDENLDITLANRSAGELLGVNMETGDNLSIVAPEFDTYASDALQRALPIDASIDLIRDGESRHFRLKVSPDPAGGCVLTFDDATRMVNAQRQLAWRDVARRIAHEIRNPLTPIQLSTERLRRRYRNEIPENDLVFDRCVETILRQVGDIDRMVQEFSSFARMPKPSVAEFDLRLLLENAAFAQSMTTPDIEVRLQTDELPDRWRFRGDERLLAQAFGNLIKNAAESIAGLPEEMEVQGQIHITMEDGPDGTDVIIEDNGRGFPESAREKLLEPYVTTREKGTGLGLAIVNRIIMDHGGSISLQNRSDDRRGARVRVFLPLAEADVEVSAQQPPSRVEEPVYGK